MKSTKDYTNLETLVSIYQILIYAGYHNTRAFSCDDEEGDWCSASGETSGARILT
jgi:hypothetical protein